MSMTLSCWSLQRHNECFWRCSGVDSKRKRASKHVNLGFTEKLNSMIYNRSQLKKVLSSTLEITFGSVWFLVRLKTINCNEWKTCFIIALLYSNGKKGKCLHIPWPHRITVYIPWLFSVLNTTSQNSKTFLDQWEACLTIWGAERREEREVRALFWQ